MYIISLNCGQKGSAKEIWATLPLPKKLIGRLCVLSINWFGITTSRGFISFFRDPTAWSHFVLRVDTTQSTAADRVRFYKDGVLLSTAGGSQPGQNTDL